jgi:uncharacterized protein YjbI with pentapeptide repeats
MSYCLSYSCSHQNPDSIKLCQKCGSKLLLDNRYRALKLIARGGFGRTFLSVDEAKPSRPPCVIKQFLPVEGESRQESMKLFQEEAIRLDDLGKHPQIPELYAYTEQDQSLFLVQEFINGQNLKQELGKSGAFNEIKIRSLLNDLLPVLQFIHEAKVIHRDVKPANIILRKADNKNVLVDFGAAKLDNFITTTQAGAIGTIGYAPPEQMAGKATYSSDIYSLGVTCIYLLTNVHPNEMMSPVEGFLWKQHIGENSVSDELAIILNKMIRLLVRQRYYSAADVLKDLNAPPPKKSITTKQEVAISNAPAIDRLNKLITEKSKFDRSKLTGKNWSGLDLVGRRLFGADLNFADLSRANLSKATMSGAELNNADLSNANLSNAKLIRAKIKHANLQDADLTNAKLMEADLSGADLSGANLTGVTAAESNLAGANLSGAILCGTDFTKANLSGANLVGADLNGVIFNHANLSGANLSGVVLVSADITNVNFAQTNLSNADLRGLNIYGTNITLANLAGAIMPDGTKR